MGKKIITVLGAGPGLGNHIGREFGSKGFKAVLMARREDALKGYVTELESIGIDADYQVVDCADNASIKSALQYVCNKHGNIDVLAYNAAVLKDGMPTELSPEELAARYQVDVAGAMCAVQQVVPAMREIGEGTILFTGGGLAFDPAPAYTSISVHKAALRAFAIALHKELENDGIYAGIVNIKGNIGSDDYYSPDNIAKLFYKLYKERDKIEITY